MRKQSIATIIFAAFYAVYLYVAIRQPQGPIDYETFAGIGRAWNNGQPIYTTNSYYPMPMVAIFAALASLPRWAALCLWIGVPVLAALPISRSAWTLAYAPLFAHFAGGQTSAFAMIGLWGYRKYQNSILGGAMLAFCTLKPQLAIFPVAWAGLNWIGEWRSQHRVARSATGFALTCAALWSPCFLAYPGWLIDWLNNARPLKPRAIAAIVPRVLAWEAQDLTWIISIACAALLIYTLYRRRRFDLDTITLTGFVVSPLVHDYDLIQVVPLANGRMAPLAVLASVPMWITILFFYESDFAWWTATLIAPTLLIYKLLAKPG